MKLKSKARLLSCFGGDRARAVADEEQKAQEVSEFAAKVASIDENLAAMARGVADLRATVEDMQRAWEELERLLPELFLHRSRWQRVKDAFRRPGGTKVAPVTGHDDAVVTVEMSPFLRKFLSMDG